MPSSTALLWSETQTAFIRIWTRITDSISYDRYAKGASIYSP